MSELKSYRPSSATSLSARLLLLTIAFVMLAEFLIYTPSIARFRKMYLEEHIAKAHLAILAVEAAQDLSVGSDLEMRLLFQAEAYGIILRKQDSKVLMLSGDMPPEVDVVFDLQEGGFLTWVRDAFVALAQDENRVMRVLGVSPSDATVMIEVLMDETTMRQAMYGYSQRILELSIVISLITAGLVYLSLQLLMVRPMRRITQSMVSFRDNPEDVSTNLPLSERQDEIGWRNANWRSCRTTCGWRCARRRASPPSVPRWPRSTTTCATAWRPRCWFPTASPTSTIPRSSG